MNQKMFRTLSLFIAVILPVLLLTVTSVVAQAQKEITVAFWGGAGEAAVVEAMIDAFEAANPDVSVESNWVQGPYEQQVLTMVAGGTPPDVMMISSGSLPGFADLFAPVSVDESVYAQPVIPAGMTYQGELRALPFVAKPKVMGLNVGAFDTTGVELPSLTEAMTPEEFQDLANSLSSGEGADRVYGSAPLWFGQWLYAFGGNFYNEDSTSVVVGSPEVVTAAQFVLDAEAVHHSAPNSVEREGINVFDWFLADKVAMWPDFGPWFLPTVAEAEDLDWEIVPVPGQGAPLEIDGFGVSIDSAEPEAAQRLALFMSQDDAAQSILASTWGLGIPVTAAGQEAFVQSDPDHNLGAFITSLETSLIQPVYCQDAQVQGEFYTDLFARTALGSGDEPLDEFLPSMETYLNETFDCS